MALIKSGVLLSEDQTEWLLQSILSLGTSLWTPYDNRPELVTRQNKQIRIGADYDTETKKLHVFTW